MKNKRIVYDTISKYYFRILQHGLTNTSNPHDYLKIQTVWEEVLQIIRLENITIFENPPHNQDISETYLLN